MDGAYIEKQTVETFGLNDCEFEHNYRVDVTDPPVSFFPGVLQVGVDDSSLELQMKNSLALWRIGDCFENSSDACPLTSPITFL
jgi:hypothetical protein